jgi:G-rich domain on putative tyrosine kinase/Chain length determinant protein
MTTYRAVEPQCPQNRDLVLFYDFLGALRKRALLIILVGVLGAVIMGCVAFTMRPVYRGFAVVAPVTSENDSLMQGMDSQSPGGILSALMGGMSDKPWQLDEITTILHSQSFTERFIKDNNLLPVLFPKLWDQKLSAWRPGIRTVPSLAHGYVEFEKIRKIDLDFYNSFVTLQIDWYDRFQAADWVNQLVDRLNEEVRSRAVKDADGSLAYLRDEMARTIDVTTRAAISRLMENEVRQKMLARVTTEYEVRVVDRAVVADKDFPLRPNKLLMIGVGLVFGMLLGVAASLGLYRRELSRSSLLF